MVQWFWKIFNFMAKQQNTNYVFTWTVAHPAPVAYTKTLVGRPGNCSGRGGVLAPSSKVSVSSMPAVASETVKAL